MKPYVARFIADVRDGKASLQDNNEGGRDERAAVQGESQEALEPVAAEPGKGSAGGRRAGIDAAGGSGKRAGKDAGADGAGVQGARSGGGSAGRVHPVEAGTGGSVTAEQFEDVAGGIPPAWIPGCPVSMRTWLRTAPCVPTAMVCAAKHPGWLSSCMQVVGNQNAGSTARPAQALCRKLTFLDTASACLPTPAHQYQVASAGIQNGVLPMSALAVLLNSYRSAAVNEREKPSLPAGVFSARGHGEFGNHEDRL